MRNIVFQTEAFLEYSDWAITDIKKYSRIGKLIKETMREPFTGLGKPEPLKGDLKGYWSRRIDDENRLIYKVDGTSITITSCLGHYFK